MIIYEVEDNNLDTDESTGSSFFATKKEAMAEAKERMLVEDYVKVTKHTITSNASGRSLAIRLLNQFRCFEKSEVVFEVKS